MEDVDWNDQAKRVLKSELVRRGISNEDLVVFLANIGVEETKAGIDSKISRGTFSAAFMLQCLNAIGCRTFVSDIEPYGNILEETRGTYERLKSKFNTTENIAEEPRGIYQISKSKTKKYRK
jgi:hypothetical protein